MNKIKIVFVIILAGMIIFLYAGAVQAEEDCASLNISHICRIDGKIEVEFVLVHTPPEIFDHGEVSYNITLPTGETVNHTAYFTKQTGDTSHYMDLLDDPGPGSYIMNSAVVTIKGVVYNLSNPGEVVWCKPTNTKLASLSAKGNKNDLIITVIIGFILITALSATSVYLHNKR